MTECVHAHDVGGAAWGVTTRQGSTAGAAGWLDPDVRARPMPTDAIFRIASVSKPIIAVAALQLVQDGLAALDEPVDSVLPELADRRVLVDPTGSLDGATVPAERPITLRDLLTFRCGLGMHFDFEVPQPVLDQMWAWGVGPGPMGPECGPDEFMAMLGRLPLSDQPGTRWRYHTGSDIVSVFIERVRGETLDVTLARDVFAPLGMVDTGFWVPVAQRARFGSCRMADDSGALALWDAPDGRWSQPPAFRSGAAGLTSTVGDLLAFGQMLLARGVTPDGTRVLAETLVSEMTTDQLTDEQRRDAGIDDGGAALGWGLGVAVRREPATAGWPGVGTVSWDGGLGSRWLLDPVADVCAVLLSTDAFTSPMAPPLMVDFVEAVAATLRR